MIWKYDGAIEVDNSAAERDADASIAADPVGKDAEASTNAAMSSRRRHSAYSKKKNRIISCQNHCNNDNNEPTNTQMTASAIDSS
jgi:hypothetical protein